MKANTVCVQAKREGLWLVLLRLGHQEFSRKATSVEQAMGYAAAAARSLGLDTYDFEGKQIHAGA